MISKEQAHVTTLPSGLQAATWTMPDRRGVSIGIWARVGGLNESAEECGISHFIEHMLFKGTAKRTPLAITQDVEAVGGDLNAYTTSESTCYYAIAPARHARTLLEVLADMLLHSTLPEREIERERQVIKEEIAMTRDQPDELVNEELQSLIWPRHALGRPLTGTPETLAQMDRKVLRRFLERNYTAGNLIVGAAGPISHEDFLEMVRTEFAEVSANAPATLQPGPLEAPDNAWRVIARPVEQTQLNLAYRAIGRQDERRYAIALLDTLLGGSMSSRLFQTLRERMALCYSIESSTALYQLGGALEIQVGLDAAKFPRALRAVLEEADRMCQDAPTETELSRAREYLVGQTELGLETTSARLSYLGESLLGYGRVLDPDEETDRIRAVTPAEVRALAQEIFTRENLSLAVVAPQENARESEDALSQLLPLRSPGSRGDANAGLLVA